MSRLSRSVATLRFFGDDLDPDELTSRLGGQPTAGGRKGEIWLTSGGREKVARSGSWRLKTEDRVPGDLDEQVTTMLDGLTPDLAVWEDLTKRFKADVFCGLFMEQPNEGQSLSPRTLKALGERNLILGLDIYGPVEED